MMKPPSFHVLNFFHDDDNSCALTILVHRTRFHIIADVSNLAPGNNGPGARDPNAPVKSNALLREYTRLLERFKASTEDGRPQSHDGSTDSAIEMGAATTPRPGSSSTDCKKQKRKKTGPGTSDAATELYRWLASPLAPHVAAAALPEPPSAEKDSADREEQQQQETLEDWYQRRPTRYFSLEVHATEMDNSDDDDDDKEDEIRAVELPAAPDLARRMSRLWPALAPVPGHIRALFFGDDAVVPRYAAGALTVVRCSADPPPYYHPSIVEVARPRGDEEEEEEEERRRQQFFFKPVDNADPDPTAREIELLHRMAGIRGLHDEIRCPRLEGIVVRGLPDNDGSDDDDAAARGDGSIVGILQTLIVDPTPLTQMFDTAVPREDRARWAREAAAMKDALHAHGVVWGDAKGDNLVVDAGGRLWIIDFGGSYTEGWVDPAVAGTREGDDMGVDKVVNALHDPVRNVAVAAAAASDDDEEGEGDSDEYEVVESEASSSGEVEKKKKKRKRTKSRERGGSERLKRRKAESVVVEEPRYCYCNGISSGTMIGCDGDDCDKEWFHVDCVGLEKMPAKEESWFCRDCATA